MKKSWKDPEKVATSLLEIQQAEMVKKKQQIAASAPVSFAAIQADEAAANVWCKK